ncbi:dihydroorotase [Methanorbis rubei]|uniref:Dihydroorotase n=1 Tax=Methanorbis rubei TaxID=3028300 RepID=A0AAE4MHG1_9EURY|nr:Dihydroorotase [Methanocorpusculaceae archaeon Cs1]
MTDLVLKSALLPDGRVADISIAGGVITHIGSSGSSEKTIDCRGCLCVPAAIDMHVHMRDGPQSAKEDWVTGTQSAVAGGVAAVVDQPNTVPAMDSAANFSARVAHAHETSFCHFAINGSVTETADLTGLWEAGALAFGEMFAAPSSYGSALSPETIRSALAVLGNAGALTTVHAEEVRPGEVHNLAEHAASRPVSGEAATVDLVNSLVPATARLHYCHMSGAASIARVMMRPGNSYEVAPHHLFLSWEEQSPSDTHFRMNPPLRTKTERMELWRMFESIPAIASDHAPHTTLEKTQPFSTAPSGVPGVETMMPLLMNAVFEGKISLDAVVAKTVTNPYHILGLVAPKIAVGSRADIAVYSRQPETILAEHLHSRCGWTPYEGMAGVFPLTTVVGGAPVWHNGEFSRDEPLWFAGKGKSFTAP